MKFTVEVSDFYINEDENLADALTTAVERGVLNQIQERIKTKVDEHLTRKIAEEVEKNMYRQMNGAIAEFIKTGKVKSTRDSNKDVTIEEYIKEKFVYGYGWSSPDEQIKKLAEKFGAEIKTRYDLLFASQLVSKLNDTGLLKKDVAKILLEK